MIRYMIMQYNAMRIMGFWGFGVLGFWGDLILCDSISMERMLAGRW